MRIKVVIIAVAAVILVTSVTASFLVSAKEKKINDGNQFVIGMSQINLIEPWRIDMNEEIQKEVKKYGNVKIIYRDAGGDTDKQKADINELLNSGIDLLIVSLDDSQKLTSVVSKAYQSMPVIVLDRAVEGYDYTLYIGPDNESIGMQAGNLVSNLIGSKSGNILEIQGMLDSPPTVARSNGFREVLDQHLNINIAATLICNWQRDDAEDDVLQSLKQNSNIDAIFAYSDYMALGAYKAVNQLGLKNIRIIGVDGLHGENGGLDLVERGILQGTFTCSTGGKEAVDYAMEILNGKNAEDIPKKIILRSDLVTKQNVSEYINALPVPSKPNKKIVLGYAQLNSESKWRDANEKSIKDAAKAAGIDLVFLESGTTQDDEKKMIRELIKRKVDIISFSPIVQSGWDDVLSEAKAAKIPVVISDRNVSSDETLWKCNIGSDFNEEGKRAARLILQNYKDTSKTETVLLLRGTEDSSPTIDRESGFLQVLQGNDQYQIIDSDYGGFNYSSGEQNMGKALKQYGRKINAVYAQNDDMALGAIQAIREYGLVPGKDILIIGTDATKQALEAVNNGEMYGTVECNPLLGPQLMDTVKKIMSGQEVPLQIIDPEDVFTKENLSLHFILGRKY